VRFIPSRMAAHGPCASARLHITRHSGVRIIKPWLHSQQQELKPGIHLTTVEILVSTL